VRQADDLGEIEDVAFFIFIDPAVCIGHDDERLEDSDGRCLIGNRVTNAGVVKDALEEEVPIGNPDLELFRDPAEELLFAVSDSAVAAHELDEVLDPVDTILFVLRWHGRSPSMTEYMEFDIHPSPSGHGGGSFG
jgi:hypothetical protein